MQQFNTDHLRNNSQNPVFSTFERYKKQILLLFGLAACGGAATTLFVLYKNHQIERAHRAYSSALETLNAEVVSENKERKSVFEKVFTSERQKWESVSLQFRRVADQYGRTSFGTLARMMEAEAAIRLGNKKDARTLMRQSVGRISAPALRSLYQLKLALLLLESVDASEQNEGRALLEKLAHDKTSPVHDAALYRLGEWYWYMNDFKQAGSFFKQVVALYGESEDRSAWVEKARKKLASIDG